jgi:argininosuccinate synthase
LERPDNAVFGPTDGIGLLTMRNRDIAHRRAKLEQYAAQPMEQGQVVVEHGILYGELPAGGAEIIAANPELTGDEEAALDDAAMEFGTD